MLGSGIAEAACGANGPRGGILRMDRCDEFEATGIYSRSTQKLLDLLVIGGTLGIALSEGTESAVGRVAWKSVDSMLLTAAITEALKNSVQRSRPSQSDNPNAWRQGAGNKSFPSGETAMMAAFVTPVILHNYEDSPAVWLLTAFPLYMGKARMASQGHWLSDVIAGTAIGVASGSYANRRDQPLVLGWTKTGGFIGFRKIF
jgi:membrane-associated phospholipid phosphatase